MQVIREKPCQRRHHRVVAPLAISIGGRWYQTANWSLGGVLVKDVAGPAPGIGTRLPVQLEIPFQGFSIAFETEGAVVRHSADDQGLVLAFEQLPERGKDLMQHFIEDLIRGKLATVEDAICRIDTPVTPISTKPDPNPVQAMPARRWPAKAVLMSLFYLLLGGSVFSYVGLLLYSNFAWLEVETAVLSKPAKPIAMPVDGIVADVLVSPGSIVTAGTPLIAVRNPELETRIENAEIDLSAAATALDRAYQRLEVEQRKLSQYRLISQSESDEASADLSARVAALDVAKRQFDRVLGLHNKGLATDHELDIALGERKLAEAKVDAARAVTARKTAMNEASQMRHHNGFEFIVDLEMLRIQIDEKEAIWEEAAARLAVLINERRRHVVLAPEAGSMSELLHSVGTQLLQGDRLAVFEQGAEPIIQAFVNQEEILQVGLGDQAVVYFPALQHRQKALVVDIDRTSGFVDEQTSNYTWRGPKDRSAEVTLKLLEMDPTDQRLQAGIPAIVLFDRRSTRRLFAPLFDLFVSDAEGQNHASFKPSEI